MVLRVSPSTPCMVTSWTWGPSLRNIARKYGDIELRTSLWQDTPAPALSVSPRTTMSTFSDVSRMELKTENASENTFSLLYTVWVMMKWMNHTIFTIVNSNLIYTTQGKNVCLLLVILRVERGKLSLPWLYSPSPSLYTTHYWAREGRTGRKKVRWLILFSLTETSTLFDIARNHWKEQF